MLKRYGRFLAALFLLMQSCSFGPAYEEPVTVTPENFRFAESDPESVINLRWWTLFNDAVLDTLVAHALANNTGVLQAVARIEEARAQMGISDADLYPRLDIQGGARRGSIVQGFTYNPDGAASNNFYISPVVSWEIDFWGKFRKASEAAKARYLANEYNLRSIQISLIAEVVSTYLTYLDFRNRLRISEETLATREESLRIIRRRFEEGIIAEIDVHQAVVQREIAAEAIPRYQRALAKTETALSVLIGVMPKAFTFTKLYKLDFQPPEIPGGLPANLLERRPDIRQAANLVQAQTADIGVAQALRLPAINLTALIGAASSDISLLGDQVGWETSGSLFGPLFNAGKNTQRVAAEEAQLRAAIAAYRETVLNAFREVEDALIEVRTYAREMASKKIQLDASESAARLSRSRYDKGVSSYLEVLETERSLFRVAQEASELQQQYLNAYIRLYKALGGGWLNAAEEAAVQAATEPNTSDAQQ
jgi:multidrug efflux system outer membrane protein